MKKFNTLLLGLALLSATILTSCSEDDDSEVCPPGISYPTSISFERFEDFSFRMWTNGAEVNTADLDFLDFIDEETAASFMEDEYNFYTYSFTQDSLSYDVNGESQGKASYVIVNDSMFVTTEAVSDRFIGVGSPVSLKQTVSYVEQCDVDAEGNLILCIYQQGSEWETIERISAIENSLFDSIDDIQEGDTLIILNQNVIYN